jgi:hypothetical protein
MKLALPVIIAFLGFTSPSSLKASYVLSFLCGAAVRLGFSALDGSNSPHHVYELRRYHVNEGKMDALKARFSSPMTPSEWPL